MKYYSAVILLCISMASIFAQPRGSFRYEHFYLGNKLPINDEGCCRVFIFQPCPILYLYQCNVDSFLSDWETQNSKLYKTQTTLLDGMGQYSEKKILKIGLLLFSRKMISINSTILGPCCFKISSKKVSKTTQNAAPCLLVC